ncbi:MAG: DMT family transporter [Pseudomonadota bacterium]
MGVRREGMLEIHAAVLLFGLAGLFGKLISAPSPVIVFGRTLFATIGLAVVVFLFKIRFKPNSTADLWRMIFLGVLLAFHWVAFFLSIQISTVAVGLLTFAAFPVFVTFMEPYYFNETLRKMDILTAVLVFAGLWFIVPSFDFGNRTTQGAFWGVLSGLSFAFLSILNRKQVASYPPIMIAVYQNAAAAIVLFPFLFCFRFQLSPNDYLLLSILGLACTALSHVLFIRSLKFIKTQLAGVIAGLEPVYGSIFAAVLLGEIPSERTIIGGILIVGSIMLATRLRFPEERLSRKS